MYTVTGEKFNKDLTLIEISSLIRKDISLAKKDGVLPKDLKISITTERYSMGQSINIAIKKLPKGVWLRSEEYRRAVELNLPGAMQGGTNSYTPQVKSWLKVLQNIHDSYNYNDSDSMTDYFDVNYYGSVEVTR